MNKKTVKVIYIILDYLISFVISFLAGIFTYNEATSHNATTTLLVFFAILSLVSSIFFAITKLYRTQLSTFGIGDATRIGFSILITNTAGLFALNFIPNVEFDIRHLIVWFFSLVVIFSFTIFIRLLPRLYRRFLIVLNSKKRVRTMIIGAGDAAKIILDESLNNPKSANNIVVFLDDNERKFNTLISNIPVEGPISNAKELIKKYNVSEVIIAIASLSKIRLHQILGYLKDSNVRIKRMPLLTEMSGPNEKTTIDVDIDELLNRAPITLDNDNVKEMLKDQTVLVTGAGGSIGSELVRQIFKTSPKTLVLFDIYENSTYDIQQELLRHQGKGEFKDVNIVTLIGSTYNEKRIEHVIKKYKPDYIYHAAAYKHVPLMEDSPEEAIRTNVIGTYNVAKLADKYKVKKMVLVSTDKAVRPTNTMGATKRFAETIIQYFAKESKVTMYAAVRFGNVLGSNGSVVPLFKKQIEEGGPVTITDKNIIRYFMTIPEAVSLILQCGLYAKGGEIFILDMGEPVKIYDLAVKLIRCAGLVPNKDIMIKEVGLRQGEKLYEELLLNKEIQKKTDNDRIYIEERGEVQPIEEEIKTISKAFDLEDNIDVKKLLQSIINTYTIDGDKK